MVETLVVSEGSYAAPRYVGVWGMGGVGKTLLLQRLCESQKVKSHFQGEMFIWLTVGQTPDIMALYRTLSRKLHLDPELHENPVDYKRYLHTEFIRKRVLLVLDDVWKDKVFDSLDLAKGRGSVTLLSTRELILLERTSPCISQVQMTGLSEQDSWRLFCVHAFRAPSNIPCELKALAQSMAEECQGLPLALKVIGGAMCGKKLPELEWEPVLKQLRQSRMQGPTVEEMYKCLKLGYDVLSDVDGRLKECFLSFAAFPEDYNFFFSDILWLWIGEGWVPGNSEDDPAADAFSLLKKLSDRSLIESVKLKGALPFTDEEDFYAFKIHDVMRDMAFYILKNDSGGNLYNLYRAGENLKQIPKELKETMELLSTVRKLSLYDNELETLPENMYAPELVSLLLGANAIQSAPQFSNFPKLRILNLCNSQFNSLPEQLGDLENLVYLNLSECFLLRILPDTVWKLRNLKCLLLWDCEKLEYLPSGMTGLTSLQRLDTRFCDNWRWGEHTVSEMPTIEASFEDICKLLALTNLIVWEIVKVPRNISALSNLKILSLSLRKMRTLPTNMPHWCIQLQQLEIHCRSLKKFPKSFTLSGNFPALIKFQIRCANVIKFPEVEAGALPKLRTLQFRDCDSLKTLPLSLKFLTSLKNLILEDCPEELEDFCIPNFEQTTIYNMPCI
jgi:disease resistance protein RPS2